MHGTLFKNDLADSGSLHLDIILTESSIVHVYKLGTQWKDGRQRMDDVIYTID